MAKVNPADIQAKRRQKRFDVLRNRLSRIEQYIVKKAQARQASIQRLLRYQQVRKNAISAGRSHKTADRIIMVQQQRIQTYNVQIQTAQKDRVETVKAVRQAESEIKGVRQLKLYALTVSYSSKRPSKNRQIEVGVYFDAQREQHGALGKLVPEIVRTYLREFYNPDFAIDSDFDFMDTAINLPLEEYRSESKATVLQIEYTDMRNTKNNRIYEKRSVDTAQEMYAYASEMGRRES